jgi:hypothetical protein
MLRRPVDSWHEEFTMNDDQPSRSAGTGSQRSIVGEATAINFLILANHVEAVNGLLYVSGGGWTDHVRRISQGGPPPSSHFGIGISVVVPWTETNQPHPFSVRIEDEDGQTLVLSVEGQLNVGRPPTLPPGGKQFAMIGLPVDVVFPKAGGYQIVARLGDQEAQSVTWPFRVHDVPV